VLLALVALPQTEGVFAAPLGDPGGTRPFCGTRPSCGTQPFLRDTHVVRRRLCSTKRVRPTKTQNPDPGVPRPTGWQDDNVPTELLYLRDAYLQEFDATVVAVDAEAGRVGLDRSAFYPTGGGQPHDIGTLAGLQVTDVRKEGDFVWHTLEPGDRPVPAEDDTVHGVVEWDRRHKLMRTHTALHVLCGVIWNQWGVPVTGGNMEPLSARMDFEFDPLPDGFGAQVEKLVNDELRAARPIHISFIPRAEAVLDADLIRTKVSLIPEAVEEIRVVDIVGLDKQADGGTHVRSTDEVGRVAVLKTESKGKGNKRIRIQVEDA